LPIANAGAGYARAASQSHRPRPRVAKWTHGPLFGRLLLMLAVVLLVSVALVSSARAGTINVWACHQPDGQTVAPIDRWTSNITASGIHTGNSCAPNGNGYLEIAIEGVSHPGHSNGSWKFTAPSGTSVTFFRYFRNAHVVHWSDIAAFRSDQGQYDPANLGETCGPPGGCVLDWGWSGWALGNTPGVLFLLEACALDAGCDPASISFFRVHTTEVTLEDRSAPTFSTLTGALASGTPLRGNAALSFQVADSGVGVYQLHATADGRPFDDRVLDTNGGRCVPIFPGSREFNYGVPCPLGVSASTRLNTAPLSDGSHVVDVRVEDAAGNTTTVFHDDVLTHNAPVMSERPELAGGCETRGAVEREQRDVVAGAELVCVSVDAVSGGGGRSGGC
jgi:hypothetical protein